MKKNKVENFVKKMNKTRVILLLITVCLSTISSNVYATNDPLEVVNNLSDFMFSILRVVGVVLSVWGMAQFGLSLKSHDPSQRAQSYMNVIGGLLIAFSKEIINQIMG